MTLLTPTRLTLRRIALALMLPLAGTAVFARMAPAQGLFDPVVKVNGAAITRYELDQRSKLLTLLRAPGNATALAREQLIEDRLKAEAAAANDVTVDDAATTAGMEEFAARGDLTAEQMIALLGRGGVAEETFRAFVRAGLQWREVTQKRFGSRVSVDDDDLELARETAPSMAGIRVLLSEIIIPYRAENTEQVMNKAQQISELTSTAAFSSEARQFSATQTRDAGGHLPWQPITQLPPVLRPLILDLAPGEVTAPLQLDGAVALFQLRAIEETDAPAPDYNFIEYAAYYIPGGRTPDALGRAAQIDAQTDTCDDLYGIAKGQPPSVLERGTKARSEIPNDVAISLSRLDPGEVSYDVTRADGQTLVLLMMCGRSETKPDTSPKAEGEKTADDEKTDLTNQVATRRLESFANGYLEQLRSEARIIEY